MGDGTVQALDFLYTPPGGTTPTVESDFKGGEGTHTVIVQFPDAATDVVVTIDDAPGAGPSEARILWAPGQLGFGEEKSNDLGLLFGSFTEMRTWSISGVGDGGLFGDQLRYRYSQLPRPPVGYKYVGWLASGDTLFARLPDSSFTTPPEDGYQELTNADTETDFSPFVVPSLILESITTICVEADEQGCFNLDNYDSFFVTLEPKSGIMMDPSPTRVQEGVTPVR